MTFNELSISDKIALMQLTFDVMKHQKNGITHIEKSLSVDELFSFIRSFAEEQAKEISTSYED